MQMKALLANCSVSISELKKNPSAIIDQAEGEPIAILNHNRPTAYLIPAVQVQGVRPDILSFA
jgi:antitoxin StbD